MQIDIRNIDKDKDKLTVKFSDYDEYIHVDLKESKIRFKDIDWCSADYDLSQIDLIIESLHYIKGWIKNGKE